jgi:Ca2+-binding EF-hand superfamily protein
LVLFLAVVVLPAQVAGQDASSQRKPVTAGVAPLARSTFISTMDSEYRKLDINKDNSVSKAEVQTANQRMAQAAAAQRARAVFESFDADRNGQINVDEFVRAQVAAVKKEDFMAVANRLDANRDQKISIVEYRALTLASFDRHDADKDGVLSVSEQRAGGFIR